MHEGVRLEQIQKMYSTSRATKNVLEAQTLPGVRFKGDQEEKVSLLVPEQRIEL